MCACLFVLSNLFNNLKLKKAGNSTGIVRIIIQKTFSFIMNEELHYKLQIYRRKYLRIPAEDEG